MSESISTTERLARVMAEAPVIHQDQEFKSNKVNYKYASAESVCKSMRPLLARHGLTINLDTYYYVDQMTVLNPDGREIIVYNRMMKVSIGLSDEPMTHITMPVVHNTPQGFQSAITFAVKYFLKSKFLLETGELDMETKNVDPREPRPLPRKIAVNLDESKNIVFSTDTQWDDAQWAHSALQQVYLCLTRLLETSTVDDLRAIIENNREVIARIPQLGLDMLDATAKERGIEISFASHPQAAVDS